MKKTQTTYKHLSSVGKNPPSSINNSKNNYSYRVFGRIPSTRTLSIMQLIRHIYVAAASSSAMRNNTTRRLSSRVAYTRVRRRP